MSSVARDKSATGREHGWRADERFLMLSSFKLLASALVLALQGSTRLISDDEIANMGPLSSLVSASWVSWATSWHKGWGKLILLVLVCIHLLAIAWYRWRKRESLVPAMWHGDKVLPETVTASKDVASTRWRAAACLLLACGIVAFVLSWGS